MAATQRDEVAIEKAKKLNYVPWCEQYERMISGQLYDSFVPELKQSRFKARQWCYHYNHDPDVDTAKDFDDLVSMKEKKLKELLGHVGKQAFIEPPFTVDYGCNIRLGERAYMNFGCVILDCGLVEIGDRTMLGPGVAIYAATHEVEIESRRNDIEYTGPVTIGNDCWIGANTIILPGVTIGKGCTIGASSVVTRSISDFSVAMGSPARVVKKVTPVPDIPSDADDGPSKP